MRRTLRGAWWGVALVLLGLGCSEEYQGREPIINGLHYPLGMAADQDNGLLYVVNSNFDLAYRDGSIVSLSLDSLKFQTPHVLTESFGGDFLLTKNAAGDQRGYVAVRGNNSVTWFSVKPPAAAGASPVLDCGNLGNEDPAACVGDHVLIDGVPPEGYDDPDVDELEVGSDPYGLGFIPGNQGEPDRLVSAAMRDGTLSLMEIQDDGKPVLVDSVTLTSGLHSVAVDPLTRQIYVTTKSYALIYRYQVIYLDGLAKLDLVDVITIPSPYSNANFARGLAITPDGKYALVATRTPNSLLVLDAAESSLPDSERAVRVVPLAGTPAQVRVFASGEDGAALAYVLSFSDDRIWAFDTQTFQPRAVIRTGAGPYDMAAVITPKLKRGFVSNFLDHSISVIDLDATSETYHQIIQEVQP